MYETGDVVVVRKRNLTYDHTHGLFWNPKMDKYIGETFTVRERIPKQRRVTLLGATTEGGGYWVFDEDWLDPAYDENEDIECGDFAALISNI